MEPWLTTKRQKLQPELYCEHNELKTEHQALSLFKSCLRYVASHLEMLESLVNFPEEIGLQIFLSAEKMMVFNNAPQLIQLFCDAYDNLILERLCLKNCHLVIGQRLEYFTMFKMLTHLDLSSCWLGEEHDVYQYIPILHSLTHLNLGANNLTDRAVQRLTSPMRLYKDRGPRQLRYLDLSGNAELTEKCLKYLTIFRSLTYLNMSGASIKVSEAKEISLKLPRLCICHLCEPESFFNQGWAANIVQYWIDTVSVKQGKSAASREKLNFYKERRRPLAPIIVKSRPKTSDHNLVYCSIHCKVAASPPLETTVACKSRPRTNDSSSFVEDDDLLAQYKTFASGNEPRGHGRKNLFVELQSK